MRPSGNALSSFGKGGAKVTLHIFLQKSVVAPLCPNGGHQVPQVSLEHEENQPKEEILSILND